MQAQPVLRLRPLQRARLVQELQALMLMLMLLQLQLQQGPSAADLLRFAQSIAAACALQQARVQQTRVQRQIEVHQVR